MRNMAIARDESKSDESKKDRDAMSNREAENCGRRET